MTLQNPAFVAAKTTAKVRTIVYWIVTALFCLQMSFTVYAELRLPRVAEAFTHLGFPAYFRAELSWAKFLCVVLMLLPVPARISLTANFKEWAYAGFAIDLASATIAHLAVGDGPEAWGWAGGHRRALVALVLLPAPTAGVVCSYAGERLTARRRRFRS